MEQRARKALVVFTVRDNYNWDSIRAGEYFIYFRNSQLNMADVVQW